MTKKEARKKALQMCMEVLGERLFAGEVQWNVVFRNLEGCKTECTIGKVPEPESLLNGEIAEDEFPICVKAEVHTTTGESVITGFRYQKEMKPQKVYKFDDLGNLYRTVEKLPVI